MLRSRIASLAALLLCCCFAAGAQAQGQQPSQAPPGEERPTQKGRVYLYDLEGIWVYGPYLEALAKARMPHRVAKRTPPVVIGISRQGRSYPVVITNFDKAAMQAALDVEPDGKPGAYRLVLGAEDRPTSSAEVKYLRFAGTRNDKGKFDRLRMAEPYFMNGRWGEFVYLGGELAPRVNRIVIAGKYKDGRGRDWEFSDAGQASWPDRKFSYELSLNDPGADCEYLETDDARAPDGKVRYGYAWSGGRLELFEASLVEKKVRCAARPFAVLSPQ
ncbi:MAG TPA: hypothetical protein VFB20_15345 [Burkholderiales bacterium]|nr:hypothetical protein [Burkholderiales bacterium]